MNSFDDEFSKIRKYAIIGSIFSGSIVLGVVGFILWASYKIMQHFGIV